MSDFKLGEGAIVYLYDDTAAAYLPVACLTSNSLSSSLEVIETQTKCDPGVIIKGAGSFAYSLDLEGNYIDTTSTGGFTDRASHDYLLQQQIAKKVVTWKLLSLLEDNEAYYGTAIITDLSADFPSGNEFATFSATLDGSGAISLTDPNE